METYMTDQQFNHRLLCVSTLGGWAIAQAIYRPMRQAYMRAEARKAHARKVAAVEAERVRRYARIGVTCRS